MHFLWVLFLCFLVAESFSNSTAVGEIILGMIAGAMKLIALALVAIAIFYPWGSSIFLDIFPRLFFLLVPASLLWWIAAALSRLLRENSPTVK